jgi:hypothetical protein
MADPGPATTALNNLKRVIRDLMDIATVADKEQVAAALLLLDLEISRYEPPILHHPDGPM